jgi:hypothetical protein
MGVLTPSSSLIKSPNPGRGLRAERADSSDGKAEDMADGGKVALMGV